MLSRTQIRQFLAVVDTGSFTRAANALNLAQPSLSGGINEMERQLGTKLFVRERHRIRLTEAGNALLPFARAIERAFHQAEVQVGNLPVPIRPIRLGVIETAPTDLIERVVAAYQGTEPLEITEGNPRELQSALLNDSLDIALTLVHRAREGSYQLLFEESYCLALSTNHPLAQAMEVDAGEVAGETMIARRACEVLADTSRFFTERGVRPRFALRSLNDERVMAMVRAGLGVTVAPRSLGGPGVAMVPIKDFGLRRTIGLALGKHWERQFGPAHPLVTIFAEATMHLPRTQAELTEPCN